MALLSYANRRQWALSARGSSVAKHFIFGFGRGVLPWYAKRITWVEVGEFAESQKALRSWLSFICSILLHPLQWLEIAPTEVSWQKKTKKSYWKRTPQEEISGLMAQVQYQCLGRAKKGHFRHRVWPVFCWWVHASRVTGSTDMGQPWPRITLQVQYCSFFKNKANARCLTS